MVFAFRLARELGYPHPDRMLAEMTSSELADWRAYHELEPFGPEIESLRAALICTVVANSLRSPKSAARKVVDFLIGYKPPDLKEQVIAIFEGLKDRGTR
jgi:hypothetical protein